MMTERDVVAGRMMRAARQKRGMTTEELAEKVSISRSNIAFMEEGKRKINIVDAIEIAKALNYSLDYLFTGDVYDYSDDLVILLPEEIKKIRKGIAKIDEVLMSLPK